MDLVSIGTIIGAIATGVGGMKLYDWRANRKLATAQASSEEADCFAKELKNTIELVKFWREHAEELNREVKGATAAFSNLVLETDKFRINIAILKALIAETTCETLPDTKIKAAKM